MKVDDRHAAPECSPSRPADPVQTGDHVPGAATAVRTSGHARARWAAALLLTCAGAVGVEGCSDEPPQSPTPSPGVETPTSVPVYSKEGITILAPFGGQRVTTTSLSIYASIDARVDASSLSASLNDVPVAAMACDTKTNTCRATGIPLDTGIMTLKVTAKSSQAGGSPIQVSVPFEAWPGKALVHTITHAEELIDGPEAKGRMGDYLLHNDKIQVVVSAPGRSFDYLQSFGGHIIDADLNREPWEAERDGLGVVIPALNIEASDNPQTISVVNDGKNGAAAELQTDGPDDLIVAMNASTMAPLLIPPEVSELPVGTYIPASADDQDIPVQVTGKLLLEPGKNYLTYQNVIKNTSNGATSFYLGDILNATGELDYFSPGFGFRADIYFRHEGELFAFSGFGSNAGVTYGVVPTAKPSTTISLPGTIITFANQDSQAVIFESVPPSLTLQPGQSYTHTRFFVVGQNIADVSGARCEALELACGSVNGKVMVGANPVAGANVTVWRPSTPLEGYTNRTVQVITHWRTGADGTFSGTLEAGTYNISANLPDSPYPSGTEDPPTIQATVEPGAMHGGVNFTLPAVGRLRVNVIDENGQPLPARVSLVGFDPSPDPLVKAVVFPGYDSTGALFSDVYADKLPYGVVKVALADVTGDTGAITVEPGAYGLVVSHGPFYSISSQRISVSDTSQTITVQLYRVIDRPELVSGDFHVHGIDSFDARVPRDFRLKGMAAEEVDVFASTDHNTRIDFTPILQSMGLSDRVVGLVGEEITTFDLGHFNAFPMPVDTAARNGGAFDWAGPFTAGSSYPSMGRYDLSPSELFSSLKALPGDRVIMANHPNTRTLGYFSLIGINTGESKGPKAYVPNCLFRQDPTANLWDDGFSALELWRTYEDDPTLLAMENLGDWFNLLNAGVIRTSLSNSDSHSSFYMPVGGPRNLIYVDDSVPFTPEGMGPEVSRRIKEGRVIDSNGPLLQVHLSGSNGKVAGHQVDLPTTLSAADGNATIEIDVQSPVWAQFDNIQVYINHKPTPEFDDKDDAPGRTYPFSNCPGSEVTVTDVPRYDVEPLAVYNLKAGRDFGVEEVEVVAGVPAAVRLHAHVDIPVSLDEDAWVVVLVKGTSGVSSPLFPVQPSALDEDSNQTLDDLMDSNIGEGGVMAQAFSNPLFVDVNDNGQFDPPGLRLNPGPAPRTRTIPIRRLPIGSGRNIPARPAKGQAH